MQRIYEVKVENKKELTKILESDPYADDSFARIGYRIRDGVSLGGEKDKIYVYISASEDFVKKADARVKDVATQMTGEKAKHIIDKITKEEESAESGLGSIFGG
jgi:hypothetical protein